MADALSTLGDPLAWRALLLCAIVGSSAGALGCVIVARRMALMGDALAHSLLPGVALAWLLLGPGLWSLFAGALGAGIIAALASFLVTRLTRIKEDAAFGAVFVMLFGLGVALASSGISTTRIDLLHFLFGNILAVGPQDIFLAAGVCTLTLACFAVFYRDILIETFDSAFYRASGHRGGFVHAGVLALAVLNLVAALQSMGIVLALGLFLLPATTASLWCVRWGRLLALSSAIAVAGGAIGILVSFRLPIPSGSAIVAVLGAIFLVSAIISPRRGALRLLTRSAGGA